MRSAPAKMYQTTVLYATNTSVAVSCTLCRPSTLRLPLGNFLIFLVSKANRGRAHLTSRRERRRSSAATWDNRRRKPETSWETLGGV
jgi:hypothetical protein